jgi:trans-2,3-dihydro-3-hydroxyanthranilate isomerase
VPSTFRFNIVDVFTDTPLAGNQLAVFTDAREIPEHMLQSLAKEIGFSETAFVYPPGGKPHPVAKRRPQGETAEGEDALQSDETAFVYPPGGKPHPAAKRRPQGETAEGEDALQSDETAFVYPPSAEDAHARIRIFTPGIEVPFAGHPTLGTAFVLGGPLQLGEIRLETGSGIVPVRLEREGARIVFGRMAQPVPTVAAYQDETELLDALGVERSELPVEVYDNGLQHVFVVLGSEAEVAALRPDLARLADVPEVLGVNCVAGAGLRWKTRMFIPSGGVAEDPATGSAAGPLALHLARHGRIAFGDEIEITQGVEIQRPSKLYARVDGSAERVERVEVGGSAVVVARGEFRL